MQNAQINQNVNSSERTDQLEREKKLIVDNIIECNKYMFEKQVACDIELVSLSIDGDTITIPAHKYILISRNHVFRAMLCGPLADGSDTVHITDVSTEALNEVLRYLYYGETMIDEDNVLELLYASNKYMMPIVATKCSEFLADNIDSDNVCMILEYAKLYDESNLVKRCLKYIQKYTTQTLNSDSFQSASKNTLMHILRMDTLSVSEDALVDAVLAWATAVEESKPKGSHVFEGLVDKIRVKSLSEGKIEELLDSKNELSALLGQSLCLMKNKMTETELDILYGDDIKTVPRLEMPKGHVTCDVIETSASSLFYNGRPCPGLIVKTNEPILINKINLLDREHSRCTRVAIAINQNGKELMSYEISCNFCRKTSNSGPVLSLSLPQPVRVEDGQFEIKAWYKFAGTSYGSVQCGVPKSTMQSFGAVVLEFPDEISATPIGSVEFSVE